MIEQPIEQPWYAEAGFSDEEWGLLVGLPQAVLTAASAVEHDGTRRTMAETAAGLEAIALGRESPSPLVNAVANEVVSRVGDPEEGEELPPIEPSDPQAAAKDTVERARAAARLLARVVNEGRVVDEGGAGAYKHWLVGIADEVVAAAPTGAGIGRDLVSPSERRFRDELAQVLND